MSRAYRIQISGVNINFHENQNILLDIELLPILAQEEMKQLLEKVIATKNSEKNKDILVISKNNVIYKIDPEKQTLEIEISGKKTELNITTYEENLPQKIKELAKNYEVKLKLEDKDLIELISQQVDSEIKKEEQETLTAMVQESLEARQFLNQVLKDVYKEAVQKKAQSMGNVTSMQEAEEDGEYRIRIEVE